MHLLQIIGLVLNVVMVSDALPSALSSEFRSHHNRISMKVISIDIKAFNISKMVLYTTKTPSACNHTLSFVFTDPNSNGTSTNCSTSYTSQVNGTNTAPTSYVKCAKTAIAESFIFRFISYANFTSFNLAFAHDFSDPLHYPPPYDYVEYFAYNITVNLIPQDAAGTICTAPAFAAGVNQITN